MKLVHKNKSYIVGIESDISNLMGLLKVAKILPEGLFIDSVVQHLKVEMAQECDYQREADCCRKMKSILEPYPQVGELITLRVFFAQWLRCWLF